MPKLAYLKLGLTFAFFITLITYSIAQNPDDNELEFHRSSYLQKNSTIVGSPQATSLGNFGAFNVSKYSGKASISVPIYSLSGKAIQAPISLSYDHSGYRISDRANFVGMGWSLTGSYGVITRAVLNIPETQENYYDHADELLNPTTNPDQIAEQEFLEKCARGEIEATVDQYYLSLPNGMSAKFYIRPDSVIVQREFQGLKIVPTFTLIFGRVDVNKFVVTDLNGNRYTFEAKEETRYELDDKVFMGQLAPFQTDYSYYSSWYLTEMSANVSNERMIFEYQTAALGEVYGIPINPEHARSVSYGIGSALDPCCGNPNLPNYSSGGSDMNEIKDRRHLSKIKYVLGTDTIETVEFISSPNTLTTSDVTDKQLDTIRVYRGKDASRAIFDFVLSYYPDTDPQYVGRLTLKSVQELASNGSDSKPPYEFSYNTLNIPTSPIDLAQDHWGYYNGAGSNTQLIPNLGKHASVGANRNPNLSSLKAGILQEVQYPTGGFTCYEYEKHEADNAPSNDVSGLRIKSIEHYDDVGILLLKRSYNYVKSDGTTSSGILQRLLDYETTTSYLQCAIPSTPGATCNDQTCTSTNYASNNRTFLGSVQGDVVGYSRVEEIIESNSGSATSGKSVCFYRNSGEIAYDQIGYELLTRKDIYDDSDNLIAKMEYTYSLDTMDTGNAYGNDAKENNLSTQTFFTFQALAPNARNNKVWLCERTVGGFVWEIEDETSDPQYSRCECFSSQFERANRELIKRFWIYPKREIATQFFYTGSTQTGEVATTQYYVYGDTMHTQPTRSIVLNSDGYEYETQTEYLSDQPEDGTGVIRALKLTNRWASPFKEIRYINQQEIYRTRLEYGLFGRALPSKLYEEFPNKAEFLSEVMSYDVLGNLHQGYRYYEQPIPDMDTLAAYQPMAMIWSHYGATLGARVQNATVGEIAYTSFENSDETTQGNWTIPSPSTTIQYDSTSARTGKGFFQASGSTQTISKGLRDGKYILTYYKRLLDNPSITNATILRTKESDTDAQQWMYVEHEIEISGGGLTTLEINIPSSDRIDELRLYPSDALMTTYAYNKDTRQMLSSMDENAIATRFEYDGLLRLKGTRNFDNHYLQTIDYEYNDQFPSNIKNAIKTWNVLKENQLTTAMVKALASGEVIKNAQYFDNIGRPIQSVGIGQSPTLKDIVSFQVYDEFGRQSEQYIPYTATTNNGDYRANFLTEQQSFITNEYGASETSFGRMHYDLEESPLNRVFKEFAQGSDWDTKPKEVRYRANSANDVRDFFQANTFYPANSLTKTIQLDEDNKQTITYTDKIGRTIMVDNEDSKTYYLYDLQGLLIQVIQPTGSNMGHSNTSLIYTDASIDAKSFNYTYDNEYRLSSKKIPGTGSYQYFYDDADQLVMTIDPKGFKLFTKYDILGRPIMTGRYTGTNTPIVSAQIYESADNSSLYYTTNQAFPDDGNIQIYTTNYFDDYDLNNDQTDEESYQSTTGYDSDDYDFVRGKATASTIATLDGDNPQTTLWSYIFYDKFQRVLQTKSDNHLQGEELIWNNYNFVGWLLKSRREHTAIVDGDNKAVTIQHRHTYDHIGRLKNIFHQIDNNPEELICENSYNERDELSKKRLGINQMTDAALQDVDYEYNIRKWLTKINDFNDANDLFAMELKYTENIADNFNNAINYNGNITAIEWKFKSEANSKIYSYEYDVLNRLETAVYGERNGTTYLNKNRYNSGYEYDANGNITNLQRNGFRPTLGNYGRIDNMDYSYFDDGRLQEIEENEATDLGFKSVAATGIAQYQYDLNGNMTSDGHKNIGVNYNYLNLPISVSKPNDGSIIWKYDAAGQKLSKQVTKDSLLIIDNPIPNGEYNANLITSTGNVDTNSDVIFTAADSVVLKVGFVAKNDFTAKIGENKGKIRHYCNGIEYFDGEMEAIYNEAGRVFFDNTTLVYEYKIVDHLGNTRVVFKDDGSSNAEEVQTNDYYAFGMAFEKQQSSYGYTFGHKEEQNELGLEWLDFGVRCLAKDMARWTAVDPLSSEITSISPYHYALNNPISFIDPTGLKPEKPDSRPETPSPSGDLYGRGGGSHVIGSSGVLDLTDEGSSSRKQKVNVALVPNANNHEYNQDYEVFSKESGIKTFRVNNTADAINQLKEFLGDDKEIGNLFLFSHGHDEDPWFHIGSTNYITEKGILAAKNLKKLGALMNDNGQVMVLSCHFGSSINGGKELAQAVSKSMNKTVFASKSWTASHDSFGNKYLGGMIVTPYTLRGRRSKEQVPYGSDDYNDYAHDNVGQWIKVSPDGNTKNITNVSIGYRGNIKYRGTFK